MMHYRTKFEWVFPLLLLLIVALTLLAPACSSFMDGPATPYGYQGATEMCARNPGGLSHWYEHNYAYEGIKYNQIQAYCVDHTKVEQTFRKLPPIPTPDK